jgi:hypothetical protein
MRFICVDNIEIPVEKCLLECRLGKRCLPIPFLSQISEDYRQKNDNEFSITELLIPSRQVYLRRKAELSINPRNLYFRLSGTAIHSLFSQLKEPKVKKEYKITINLNNFTLTGIIDEIRENTIVDFKTISYEFLRLLQKDPSLFNSHSQLLQYQKQLYYYYYLFKKKHPRKKIDKLEIHFFPRDIPPQSKDIYYIYSFPPPDNLKEIEKEIIDKMSMLYEYLINNILPPLCDIWNGERCLKYCDVNSVCPFYRELTANQIVPPPKEVPEISENEQDIYSLLVNYFYASRMRLDAEKEEQKLREKILQYMLEKGIYYLKIRIDGILYQFNLYRRISLRYEIPEEIKRNFPAEIKPYFIMNVKKLENA